MSTPAPASSPDPLHPFDVGDLVVTTTPLTVHMGSIELCPAGETLQVVGLSGNAMYPISVCKPNDPFWRVAVLAHEIQPLPAQPLTLNHSVLLLHTSATFNLATLDALRLLPAQEYDNEGNPTGPLDPAEHQRLVAFYTGRVIYRVRVVCDGKHAAFESAPVLPEDSAQALEEVFALAAKSCAQHLLQQPQP